MRNQRIFITFFFLSLFCYPIDPIDYTDHPMGLNQQKEKSYLENADTLFVNRKYPEAIANYKRILNEKDVDKAHILKKIAQSYSALKNTNESIVYIEEYLREDFNMDIFADSWFDNIRDTQEFTHVSEKYSPKLSIWSFMYLYVALIGFYVAILLNFNKKIDKICRILVSSFIFIHSAFILHIYLNITNYHFRFPHSYFTSTVFSFLYGPLLYLYFKRITQHYKLRARDILHLIPTFIFLIFVIPIYSLTVEEKLAIMLDRVNFGLNSEGSTYIIITFTLKLISLSIYGYFIRKIYLEYKNENQLDRQSKIWQRNIYMIHFSYIISYAIYGILAIMLVSSGFFFHAQVTSMALMVIYVGYCANVQPNVFNGSPSFSKIFFKYEKSGLTSSLSKELKTNLIHLFDEEKIYKENDINLEKLADRLNTTRHNASQVINEHFGMNFHELVNGYRINEAKKIFNKDNQRNLNIIDVAYEVGYNNKVTFNKAFKKDTKITPSEYQKTILEAS